MRNADLRLQPRNVQEEFEKITDAEVDRDPLIVQLKAALEQALVGFSAANEENDRVLLVIKKLDVNIDCAKSRIEAIEGQRPEVVSAALLDGRDFKEDDALVHERLALDRYIERMALARPELERYQRSKSRAVEIARHPCTSLEDQINDRRDELKLLEAQRRNGY